MLQRLTNMMCWRNTVRPSTDRRPRRSRHHPNDLLSLSAAPIISDIRFAPTRPSDETLRILAHRHSRSQV
jgi:hypothetical protein